MMCVRDGKLFGRGFFPALLLSLLLAAGCAAACFSVLKSVSSEKAAVQVALVDEEGGMMSRICINLVSTQPFMQNLLSMETVSRDAALEGLRGGLYAAVIILPDGYTDNITSGNIAEGQLILSEAAASQADLVAEVAAFGERLLAAGQVGVFAGQRLLDRHDLWRLNKSFLAKSNSELIDFALESYNSFNLIETDYDGSGLTAAACYAAAWLVLFLLAAGLFFPALYRQDMNRPLLVRLYALGVKPSGFLCWKIVYPFLYRLLLLGGLGFFLSRILPLSADRNALAAALLGTLLATLYISCAELLLAEQPGAGGLLLALAAAGLFLSGGIVPHSMLPAALLKWGAFLPSGVLADCFSPLFGGCLSGASLSLGCAYALLLLILCLRKLRLMPLKGGVQ